MQSIVIGTMPSIGICEINEKLVVEKWNHLWLIHNNRRTDSYMLIKHLRKDSDIKVIKLTISKNQAYSIISKLRLNSYKSKFFKGLCIFRRRKDKIMLDNYYKSKHGSL